MKHAFTHGLLLTAACALTLTFLACENKLPLPSARSGDVRASADELVQTDLVATSQLDGGTHSYTATLPPTAGVGTITQTLEATWDWMLHSPSAPPIHPQGWSIDYYAGGTKLTSAPTTPSGWASVSRIVSTGSTTVDGLDGERQVLLSTISAPPVVVASSFSSGSVGDGWDVFFDPAYTKVFNIHHHSGPATVMCRKLVDGTACPGFPIDLTKTANRSTGKIDAESNTLWQPTVASGSLAWDCVDLTGSTRCAIPVVQSSITTTSGGEDYDNHVDPVVIGRKMYAIGYASDNTTRITCLDMATRAECPGVRLPQNGTAYGAGLEAVGTRLYVLPGSGASLDCYDSTTWTRCPGSWPQTVENSPVWGVRGADGVVHNVCANGRCFALDGSAHTLPPNFITALEADPVQEFIGKATSLGTKAAWTTNGGTVICWDMLTDARCSAAFPLPVDVVYAPTLDPENPDCLWTNGDDGVIRNYKISTGAPGCSGGPPRISFKATVAIPRLGCDPSSRVHQYKSFKLVTPSPSQYTSATLTVKNSNGAPIAGWTNKPISSADPTVDLSALSTALAGETPTFDVAAAGFTDTSVVPVAEFRVTPSSTPQLCWSLSVPEPTCPTTAGLASNATAGPRTTTVTAKGSIAQEAPAKPYTDQAMSATVNANPPDFTRCGGTLNATVGTGTGAPVAGLQVFLLDGAANPVLDGDGQPVSALSTASGGVSFPVWASTYKLKVSASARYTPTSMTVTAGGSGTTTASDGVVTSEAVSTTVGGTSSVTAVVDVLPPPPPSISSPASGARLGSATPVIRGTCLDGATVNVYADGSPLCTATCADDAFTCTSAILRDGAHTLYATQTDASATSTASAATSFSVDTAPPDTTLVTGPPSSTTSTSASFDFDSNEPGSSYECSLDDASFASCTDPVTFTDLSTGNHSLEVRARDAAGNEDPIPAAYDWRIEPVLAPSGLTFTTPANGSLLLDKSPTYSGTAGPGLEVLVKREDGVGVCTATADAAGAWSCVEPDTLVDGPHTRLAVSGSFLVAAGEPASTTFTVTTPVTPPAGGSDGGSGGSQDAGEPGAPPPSPEAGLSVYGRGCSSSGGSPLVWLMLLAVPLLRSRRSRPTARGSISSPSSR